MAVPACRSSPNSTNAMPGRWGTSRTYAGSSPGAGDGGAACEADTQAMQPASAFSNINAQAYPCVPPRNRGTV